LSCWRDGELDRLQLCDADAVPVSFDGVSLDAEWDLDRNFSIPS
jgi:hypothetical protein